MNVTYVTFNITGRQTTTDTLHTSAFWLMTHSCPSICNRSDRVAGCLCRHGPIWWAVSISGTCHCPTAWLVLSGTKGRQADKRPCNPKNSNGRCSPLKLHLQSYSKIGVKEVGAYKHQNRQEITELSRKKSRITTWVILDFYNCLLFVYKTYFTSSKTTLTDYQW